MVLRTTLAVIGAVALAALAMAVMVVVAGLYHFAADEAHWPSVERTIEWARMRAIAARAHELQVPSLGDAQVRSGAREYEEMCTGCHLAPGTPDRAMHDGLYPRPPDFTKVKTEPRVAFWTIKHGVKMTGMPAWGASHDDETIWSLVAFLQKLPGMDEATYRRLVDHDAPAGEEPATMHEHDAAGHTHTHTHTHK